MTYPHTSADCAGFHDLVRDFGGDRPTIICLCGSTRFRDEFARVNRELTRGGAVVVAPGVFGHSGDPFTDDDKQRLDALHLRKIDLADEVFVVNPPMAGWPGGYFGESTRKEVAYAKKLGKPVRYLSNPSPSTAPGACRCGHPVGSHDAGQCWAPVDGGHCSCSWYESAEAAR